MKIVTMGQGTAERYVPASDREVCISITTPGAPDANLSALFADVLRLKFCDDPWADWRDRQFTIRESQAARVAEFALRHRASGMTTCVIHCTVGASRSVSMAMALEEADVAEFEKPEWWNDPKVERPNRGIPSPSVYERVLFAVQRAQRGHARTWDRIKRIERDQRGRA